MIQVGPYTLDDFQERAVLNVRSETARLLASGPSRVLLASPTGSGKTIKALALIQATVERGNRAWFITSGRQLIFQMARTLETAGMSHTVLMSDSGYGYSAGSQVTVVSKDTLASRMKKGVPHNFPDVLIVDEADVCTSAEWTRIINECRVVIGLTATPCDGHGRGLGNHYQSMVEAATFSQLIESGRLVDIPEGNVFCPYRPDLTGAKTSGGDFNGKWLQGRMDRAELVGDIVSEWKKHGQGRPTVVFCSGVDHSIHVSECFNGSGIRAEHIDGSTSQEERDEIFSRVRSGDVTVVTNCAVLDRGWNEPSISCGVLAKPTKRMRGFIQMVGRLIRSAEGKRDAILIDHAGAVFMHGWPTEDRVWSLDAGETIEDRELKEAAEKQQREPYCCPECACMWERGNSCPNCGYRHRRRGKPAMTVDGELVEVKRKQIKKATSKSDPQRQWMSCLGMAANRGMKYSQASVIFKRRTGKWPDDSGVGPLAERSQRGMLVAAIWPKFKRKKLNAELEPK